MLAAKRRRVAWIVAALIIANEIRGLVVVAAVIGAWLKN